MLDKAVAAVKADKTKALDMFNKGEGGFLDRDLYPFCFNISDAKIVAVGNPNAKEYLLGSVAPKPILGLDGRTLHDAAGNAYGLEMYVAAQKPESEITDKTGRGHDAGSEGEFRYQGGRSWLRCRLLQVARPEADLFGNRGSCRDHCFAAPSALLPVTFVRVATVCAGSGVAHFSRAMRV